MISHQPLPAVGLARESSPAPDRAPGAAAPVSADSDNGEVRTSVPLAGIEGDVIGPALAEASVSAKPAILAPAILEEDESAGAASTLTDIAVTDIAIPAEPDRAALESADAAVEEKDEIPPPPTPAAATERSPATLAEIVVPGEPVVTMPEAAGTAAGKGAGERAESPAMLMVRAIGSETATDRKIGGIGKEDRKNGHPLQRVKPVVPQGPSERVVRVGKGNTLSSILAKAGVRPLEADEAIAAVRKVYNPRRLKVGQEITLTFGPPKDGKGRLSFQSLNLAAGFDRIVGARRNDSGGFSSVEVKKDLKTQLSRVEGNIHYSLSRAALSEGVPREVLAEMIAAFSYDVDFQRDIQVNDSFELLFEQLYDGDKRIPRSGKLLFASMTLSGVRIPIYRFEVGNGASEFFNEKGESVYKALLRTPIDGGRLSSRYGKRKHPILGYSKMHRGIDFAARTGTPIKAAGDGVVTRAGRYGAYGNYVRIRHNSEYSTAFAHLSRYAKGIRTGRRVKQGETIGYVGSTGRSTGPHLHFEVIRRGVRINPLSVKLPSGKKLAGVELENFLKTVEDIKREYAALPKAAKVANRE